MPSIGKQIAQELVTMAAIVGLTVALMSSCAHSKELSRANIDPAPSRYDHTYKHGIDLYLDGPFQTDEHGKIAYFDGKDPESAQWAITVIPKKGERCQIHLPPVGTVIGDQKLDEMSFLTLFLHERGHCNGWKHDEPGM